MPSARCRPVPESPIWAPVTSGGPSRNAVVCAGRKILNQHVANLHQPLEYLQALLVFGIDGDRALVAVQHREVETVRTRNIAELSTGDVTDARPFDLDYVGAHIGEQLRAGWPRLDMGKIENAHSIKRLAIAAPGSRGRRRNFVVRVGHTGSSYFFLSALCGFNLLILPLSLPAAGSIAALMTVGLPESMALLTARLNSSGVV